MSHRGGNLEKRRITFLIHQILGAILSVVLIGVMALLVVENYMALGWGIFFIGYYFILLILDTYWSTGIIFIKRRWRYWVKTRDDADLFKKIKDPQEFQYWKRFHQRRIALSFLGFFYFLALGIWGFLVTNQLGILLFIIVFVAILIVVTFLRYPDILLK
ncbi:MAG: hypothetical protein LUQ65_07100 [Candidatus Helarchaeota archaeon]|nr:hypothetical protein [Candidatus Helarchaeota archaeon]